MSKSFPPFLPTVTLEIYRMLFKSKSFPLFLYLTKLIRFCLWRITEIMPFSPNMGKDTVTLLTKMWKASNHSILTWSSLLEGCKLGKKGTIGRSGPTVFGNSQSKIHLDGINFSRIYHGIINIYIYHGKFFIYFFFF